MRKKAVSPLIATVLLIAFAVVLGAVVINWARPGIGVPGDKCAETSIAFERAEGFDGVCYNAADMKLQFTVTNKASDVAISGVKVKVLSTSNTINESMFQQINAGDSVIIKLGYQGDPLSIKKITILPFFTKKSDSGSQLDLGDNSIIVCQDELNTMSLEPRSGIPSC